MRINFFSALRPTRAAVTFMVDHGGGAIVNVASVNAFFQPHTGTMDYGAANAALVNVTKALSSIAALEEHLLRGSVLRVHVSLMVGGPSQSKKNARAVQKSPRDQGGDWADLFTVRVE
jgi:NAD(P)-dependent dehydrogenase (short-subunit alcohol dehydrogenase family)